ncbi:putative methionine-R-sulfoxide reductase SelR [Coniochaeta ligniaria NRRL 30616]|uniref:Peptide-methionine (R)-S-oxide reductase n=1 Tax=Coniochaeta ligniaria NRRL 30616 TaxID=1408157 RepID=A0A1J7J7V8_9PEZI|nr:putative methionine-R-sulfoxide reductase SelR [Coniochaeta ligniaria NRRL 30616]
MRFHPFSSVIRTLYTLSSLSTFSRTRAFQVSPRITTLRSMPSIPILSALFGSSSTNTEKMSFPVEKSNEEWRAVLSPQQFRVLRQQGTEAPGSGTYDKHYPDKGVYTCAGCDAPLYTADTKFKSGCGWPAYFDSIPGAVKRNEDSSMGMTRTEIVCANCGGHLGHVFKGEGFPTPTDERHCVNSVSLKFAPEDKVGSKA